MSDDAPRAAAGWYPTSTGGQRYWDGTNWLDVPAPEPSFEQAPQRPATKTRGRRVPIIVALIAVVLLVISGGVALAVSVANDHRIAAEETEAAEKAAADKAAAAEQARQREADRAEAADASKRRARATAISGIEDSIQTMAEEHITDEIIDGPVLSVDCSPVNGGSTDDVTEQTTVFECFVANEDNGDGTMSGYTYNATMNWTTGSYTYGLGAP